MNLIEYIETHQVKAAFIAIGHLIAGITIPELGDYHIPAIVLETLQGLAYIVSITVGTITICSWIYKKVKG